MPVVRARLLVAVLAIMLSPIMLGAVACGDDPPGPASSVGVESTDPAVTATPGTSPGPASPSPGSAAAVLRLFPVVGKASYSRGHHDYPASDIIAPCGAKIRATISGTVLEVNRVDRWDAQTDDGAWRGGRFLSVLGDDGVRYYYAHFESIEAKLAPGVEVARGERLGTVGRTGKAGVCHLHFGLSPPCAGTGDWAVRRGVLWPWPYLDSWRATKVKSPVKEAAVWEKRHKCVAPADA